MLGCHRLNLSNRILYLGLPLRGVAGSGHNQQIDLVDRGLVKLKVYDAVAAVHQVGEKFAVHNASAGEEEIVAGAGNFQPHKREITSARANVGGEIAAVFVAITNKRHRVILKRRQQEGPGRVALRLVLFDGNKVRVDVHSAKRALSGNVLHFAGAVAVENLAPKNPFDGFALRLV